MGSQSPPDGWSIDDGEWGTDIDRDTNSFTGTNSILFKSGGADVEFRSDFIPIANTVLAGSAQVLGDQYFTFYTLAYASAIGASKRFRLRIEFYDSSGALIGSPSTIFDTGLTAINTWEAFGQNDTIVVSSPRYARLVYDRPADRDFDLYIDVLDFRSSAPFIEATGTFSGSIGGGFQKVDLTAAALRSFFTFDASTDEIICSLPGVYCITGSSLVEASVADGDMFHTKLTFAPASGGTVDYPGSTVTIPRAIVASNAIGLHVSVVIRMETGDAVSLWHDPESGNTANVLSFSSRLQAVCVTRL